MRGFGHVCLVKMEESLCTLPNVSLNEFLMYSKLFRRIIDLMTCGFNQW